MKISVRWLNEYLDPANITADGAEQTLTFCGFPIESAQELPNGDVCIDVEVTSNRGDCLSHIGVAREIAAATGRRLRIPAPGTTPGGAGAQDPRGGAGAPAPSGADVSTACSIDNRVTDVCKLFTARIIRGVTVGASPKWMVDALAAVGQRSINNVVDVTNFVALEYGQPSHVFDLATVQRDQAGKARIVVRMAAKGEKLALLDGKTITLAGDEVVVGDEGTGGPRAISLAGVMGGALTQVTAQTTDVLLEAATWDPVVVRRASRRHGVRTEASHRFERIVDPRTIERAAARAAALIVKLSGGRLAPGVINAGVELRPASVVKLRPSRCRAMLGLELPTAEMTRILMGLEVDVKPESAGGTPPHGSQSRPVAPAESALVCTVPVHRPDLEREIDLIEEVARTHGLDKLPVHERVGVRVSAPQESERAMRELAGVLTGLGFYEAVTFTFVSARQAAPFLPQGMGTIEVCDERRKADPVLRPSALPSLLACRRKNADGGASGDGDGGVRLFEVSAVFAAADSSAKHGAVERRNLAIIADACFPTGAKALEQKQAAVRLLRGTLGSVAAALGGAGAKIELEPVSGDAAGALMKAYDPSASAAVMLVTGGGGGANTKRERIGIVGVLSSAVQKDYDLAQPVVMAEVNIDSLMALWPPKSLVHALPEFPSIERDLSLIVGEQVSWERVARLVEQTRPALLEETSFVGAYRGQQIGAGKKSVTLRMRFRDPARTLRHEEVDPQMSAVMDAAKRELGAEIRV